MTSSKPSEAEKKSSKYRYGREEMLAMFAPALPVPSDLRDMTIFCLRELLPIAFLPVTEDEQEALLQCVNSNLALRSTQRAVPSSQGGRTVAMEQKKGRGRGRTDASLRNSKANDGRSETSESVCSDDWRKEKTAEKARGPSGNDGVTRAPSKSVTCELSNGSGDELDAAEDLKASQCSIRLSCGVATSLSEDVNFKTANIRVCSSGASLLNFGIHKNANSEQLDRHKPDRTTTLSCDSVISSNVVGGRHHGVDRRLSVLAPSVDTKRCSGDSQQLAVNCAKGKVVDTSVMSYARVHCSGSGLTNVTTNDVSWSKPMCDKDVNVCEDSQRNGFLTAEAGNETWFYKDPNGQLQGPFTSRQMEGWFLMGYFTMKLLIRLGRDGDFVLLGDLIKAHGRVPFLSNADKEEFSLCRDQSVLPDQVMRESEPVVDLPFCQQSVQPTKTYNVSSTLPDVVAPPLLRSHRPKTRLSSAASVASRESGWPLNSAGSLNSKIEGKSMATVDREKIEEELKKRIEKQLKEKIMLELEREKLRLEQLKIEEERQLMIEHHRLLEDEKRRQEERRKMEDERRQLEEERRKLEELHRKAEEERRLQEHLRMERQREELERRKIEEDRKLLEEERHQLEELHRKTEEDRRALERLRLNMSDNSDDNILTATEEERFKGKKWCTWEEAVGSGDGEQLKEKSEFERLHASDEGRMLSANGAESDVKKPDEERQMVEEASDIWQKEMQVPKDEGRSTEKSLSLKGVHETKKKLVPWNSSSKNEMEKQCSPTSTVSKCPWATSLPSVSSQPSAQPQDVGTVKGDEPLTSCEEHVERLNEIQQQKKQTSFNWSEQRTEVKVQSKVPSFLEIQEEQAKQEEEEKKRKELQQQQQQLGKVPIKMKPKKAVSGNLPRRSSASAKDTVPTSSSGSSLCGAPSVPGLMSLPIVASVSCTTQQPWNPNGLQMAASTEMNEFMVWCHRALPTTNSSVDVPTLIDFLMDIESPYELYDYIRLYLGESKQVMDFAHEFLERRKRLQMRMNRAALGYRLTPVYPSFAFGYQTGMFYQPYGGNLTNPLHPDKVKGQKVML